MKVRGNVEESKKKRKGNEGERKGEAGERREKKEK